MLQIICDIDGTLNHINQERLKLIQKECPSEADFMAFLAPGLVAKDLPQPKAQEALLAMANDLSEVFFVTGRRQSLESVTRKWLKKHFGVNLNKLKLFMRPNDSYDTATEYKSKFVQTYLMPIRMASPCRIDFLFIDDDPFVLHLYSQYGIALKAPECWDLLIHKKPAWKEERWSK